MAGEGGVDSGELARAVAESVAEDLEQEGAFDEQEQVQEEMFSEEEMGSQEDEETEQFIAEHALLRATPPASLRSPYLC